jgi:hypothetical protein
MKRTAKILLFILTSLVLALVLNFALHRRSNRVIAEWKQVQSVQYKSFDPYYLSVVEGNVDWSFFLPGWERHYFIFVGRGSGTPEYGHYVEFSFHPAFGENLDIYVKSSKVEWSETGVTLNEPSGYILFIPKEMYIGGR